MRRYVNAMLPQITHLQFLVLGELLRSPAPGRQIRSSLVDRGVRKSGPAFYQMMARMEDASLLEGWYEQQIVDGQIIRERHYRIVPSGRKAWDGCRDFYEGALKVFDRKGLAHG
jgi:DNA-binding PadR family transcriptional regulator